MNLIAIKMLVGDKAKYVGIIIGLTFASLLITQQSAIFDGILTRTYSSLNDLGLPDVWVMDERVQFVDDIKPLRDTALLRVRGVDGVHWAVPLYKGVLRARLPTGTFQSCNVLGIDDATMIGGPPVMVDGKLEDLRRADGVIVDVVGAGDKLATRKPDGTRVPLRVGDTMELNDRRALVVGLCRVTRTFQSQPVVYTTYSRATLFAPSERMFLSFVLVKAKPGTDVHLLCERIKRQAGLGAYTADEFKTRTRNYYLRRTGIPINFGIAVVLSFIVGTAVAGMMFYNFTLDNLRYFGTLKAMGGRDSQLLTMIFVQTLVAGFTGYGVGVGCASIVGWALAGTELAFRLPWWQLLVSAAAVLMICLIASLISIRKVIKLEPAIVFK